VGESVENPAKYYQNNVGGMLSLLDTCVAANVRRFIFSSSCATYGIPETLPIRENSPQNPINPYGWTKLIGEQMLQDYARAHSLQFAILRYFNACGADPEGELTEKHDPETHLIPLALMAAARARTHLSVFGTDYDTPDGSCLRDYIHVSDLARGHLMALDHIQWDKGSLAVNLGTGQAFSIFEVLNAIEQTTGLKVPTKLAPRRPGDPPVLMADVSNARKELGFVAEYTTLDQIIRHAAPSFGIDLNARAIA